VTSTSGGISGVGLAVIAGGAVLVWSGIQNRGLVESFRYLAQGKPIPAGVQKVTTVPASFTGAGGALSGSGNSGIVSIAATYKGHPYIYSGGHKTVCPSGGMDCSGFVSCVLNKAGLLKGTLNTDSFARWGVGVPFAQRQSGDLVIWKGGPGGGHMGIVIDATTMWHNPCTGCGGVQIGRYGSTRTGRQTIVRRAKSASTPQPRPIQV
jgi:cell wall-associated NlpC family hydrolase